jgi:hypothetical protein
MLQGVPESSFIRLFSEQFVTEKQGLLTPSQNPVLGHSILNRLYSVHIVVNLLKPEARLNNI